MVPIMDNRFLVAIQKADEMARCVAHTYSHVVLLISCPARDGTFLVSPVHSDIIHSVLTMMKGHPHCRMSFHHVSEARYYVNACSAEEI